MNWDDGMNYANYAEAMEGAQGGLAIHDSLLGTEGATKKLSTHCSASESNKWIAWGRLTGT